MNVEKNINSEDIVKSTSKNDSDLISIDFNQTATTQANESLQIKENIHINNNFDINQNEKIVNKNNKRKSSLKGSKEKINYIKKEILKLFDEDKIIEKLNYYQSDNYNINNIDNIFSFQEKYETELEKLFNNKMEKIDEINNKYESELNELQYYIEQENKEKSKEDNSKSGTNILYEELVNDKNKDLNELNITYKDSFNNIKNNFMNNIDTIKINEYNEELFNDIKDDILKLIKPKNNKKVNFE